jgi:hypothetical protein
VKSRRWRGLWLKYVRSVKCGTSRAKTDSPRGGSQCGATTATGVKGCETLRDGDGEGL